MRLDFSFKTVRRRPGSTGWYSMPIFSVSHIKCPLHTNSVCGKSEAHNNCSMVIAEKAAPVT